MSDFDDDCYVMAPSSDYEPFDLISIEDGSDHVDLSIFEDQQLLLLQHLQEPNKILSYDCPSRNATQRRSSLLSGNPSRAMTPDEMADLLAFLSFHPSLNTTSNDPAVYHHLIPTTGQIIHCVAWSGHLYITNCDIKKVLKVLVFDDGFGNLDSINLAIITERKFDELVFSVLRQLKVGLNCQVEESRSEFLTWLAVNGCIRTTKKQKVFYWEDVNLPALAREVRSRISRAVKCSPRLDEECGPNSSAVDSQPEASTTLPSSDSCYLTQTSTRENSPVSKPRSVRRKRDYHCTYPDCSKDFSRLEHLKRHLRTHSGEKLYACNAPACCKTFSCSDHLVQHLHLHIKELTHGQFKEEQLPSQPASKSDLYSEDSGLCALSEIVCLREGDNKELPEAIGGN